MRLAYHNLGYNDFKLKRIYKTLSKLWSRTAIKYVKSHTYNQQFLPIPCESLLEPVSLEPIRCLKKSRYVSNSVILYLKY